jgi:hypothetical protein
MRRSQKGKLCEMAAKRQQRRTMRKEEGEKYEIENNEKMV